MTLRENGKGILNFNSELELWTRVGRIKVNLSKGLDIRRLDRLISEAILGDGGSSAAPAGPATAAASAPAVAAHQAQEAAWLPDPRGKHELRYWDGGAWTAHVSDEGVQSTD